jgi:hypothetical protein
MASATRLHATLPLIYVKTIKKRKKKKLSGKYPGI